MGLHRGQSPGFGFDKKARGAGQSERALLRCVLVHGTTVVPYYKTICEGSNFVNSNTSQESAGASGATSGAGSSDGSVVEAGEPATI